MHQERLDTHQPSLFILWPRWSDDVNCLTIKKITIWNITLWNTVFTAFLLADKEIPLQFFVGSTVYGIFLSCFFCASGIY